MVIILPSKDLSKFSFIGWFCLGRFQRRCHPEGFNADEFQICCDACESSKQNSRMIFLSSLVDHFPHSYNPFYKENFVMSFFTTKIAIQYFNNLVHNFHIHRTWLIIAYSTSVVKQYVPHFNASYFFKEMGLESF